MGQLSLGSRLRGSDEGGLAALIPRELGHLACAPGIIAEELASGLRALVIQADIVLVRHADSAKHLDAF